MKIRSDFVTNSSSSSFIIAYKPMELDSKILKNYPFLEKLKSLIPMLLNSSDDFDTMSAIELNDEKIVKKIFSYKDEEDLNEILEKVEKYLKNGFHVYEKDISNYNETVVEIFESLENDDNFKILYREE